MQSRCFEPGDNGTFNLNRLHPHHSHGPPCTVDECSCSARSPVGPPHDDQVISPPRSLASSCHIGSNSTPMGMACTLDAGNGAQRNLAECLHADEPFCRCLSLLVFSFLSARRGFVAGNFCAPGDQQALLSSRRTSDVCPC